MRTLLLLFVLGISLIGFSQEKQNSVKLIKQKHLTNLPSASAVKLLDGSVYIIGDDSPFLYKLDSSFAIISKTLITGNDSMPNGRVPKAIKADFESMAVFQDKKEFYLLVLSSGSKEITRDTIHLISLKENRVVKSKNVRPLYNLIIEKAGLPLDGINIEALIMNKSNVYMMQRGNNNENLIMTFNTKDFMKYLNKENANIPDFSITRFLLPAMENTLAGFSGACILKENSGLLFTASLEASTNVYDDGEILGSYVGTIKFSDFEEGRSTAELVVVNGETLKTKLEGISNKSVVGNKITIIAVSDNDDGTSWIYEMEYVVGID